MVQISRRHFLQGAGATLTTWGLHHRLARHQAVLAQSTPRKLAFIVGINTYRDAPLGGCVNDAILQQRLLIHRFGFHPNDVVLLLNENATRQNILDTFEEHLIKQAKPGDVAVFHYSGHGSLVRDPDPIFVHEHHRGAMGVNGTFVPADSHLPNDFTAGGTVNDIMGHTLFLLMAAIQTENFTAVLDSCFAGGATRNMTVRSREVTEKITIAPQEKAYQEDWLARLDWNHDQFVERYQRGIANGVVLAATQRHQLAIDEQFPGFMAGAFSYRLTQHLWQTEANPEEAIAHISGFIPPGYRQQPLWEAKPGTENETAPMFFINQPNPSANAVVVNIAQDQATVLLVGIPPNEVSVGQVLRTLNRGAQIVVIERQGLVAMGRVQGSLQQGDVLRV